METVSATVGSSTAAPGATIPASAPQGPAPGPKTVTPDGKPAGPQYISATPGTPQVSPQDIQKKWASDRAARAASVKASVLGGDPVVEAEGEAAATEEVAVEDVATEEVAVETAALEQEGESEGKDVTKVADSEGEDRQKRITEAARKAKAQSARNKQLLADVARRDADMAKMRERTAQLEAAAKRGDALEQSLRENPLQALERLGVTPEALAQRVMLAGTPEEKFAALQAQVEAERAERQRLESSLKQREDAARFATNLKAAEDAFVKQALNVERYPNLEGHPRAALLAMGKQVAQDAKAKYLQKTGAVPEITDKQILTYLNKLYAKSAPKSSPTAPSKVATATPSKATKSSGTASPKPASPRTLTGANSAGSFVRPANWESMSRTERVQLMRQDTRRRA